MAGEYELAKYPVFATKVDLINTIRGECHNSPAIHSILMRLANTDVTGLADGATVTKATFNL